MDAVTTPSRYLHFDNIDVVRVRVHARCSSCGRRFTAEPNSGEMKEEVVMRVRAEFNGHDCSVGHAPSLMVGKVKICQSCGSLRNQLFNGEVAIHFPAREGLTQPIVAVFPELRICLSCGVAEFVVPPAQLDILRNPETPGQTVLGVGA